jgi:hypothetical protein
MSDRSRSAASLAATLVLVALAATPVLAKEGAEAKLDTAIARDAPPGSTLDVGWSTFMIVDGKQRPVYGSSVYMRLVGPDGTTTEAAGKETPPGSGHYTASIVVPQGGIDQVIVRMVGEACYQGGGCKPADYVFPLTDDLLVTGAAPVTGSASGSLTPIGSALLPLIVIGVASALAAGLGALFVARRRPVGVETAGGASGE